MLLTITINGSIKFRSLERDCRIREGINNISGQSPSHVTIRNWTLKIGYHELVHHKEKAEDWIILLDHSIQFGREKIFVVLGITERDFLKTKRPLQYADMKTLLMINKTSWNGELVAEELRKLKGMIGGIKYAVGDYGSDLRKGLLLSKIPHVHDLSHLIALITEKLYKTDDRFAELKIKKSTMRSKFVQTDIAATVPPKGRKKSEYQSFDKIIKWGNAVLDLLNNKINAPVQLRYLQEYFEVTTLDKIKTELSWVYDYSELFSELSEINNSVKAVEKELKHNGLSKSSLEKCKKILAKLKSKNGESFRKILNSKLEQQMNLLPDTESILFSSDILESVFGKYKNRVSDNPMASITSLMLIIAAFTSKLDQESIKKSMENVKIEDIKKWSQENIGISLFAKRKALLSA